MITFVPQRGWRSRSFDDDDDDDDDVVGIGGRRQRARERRGEERDVLRRAVKYMHTVYNDEEEKRVVVA